MDWAQLNLRKDKELKSKPQELSQENPWTNLCKPVLNPLIVWFQSEEDKENWSSETDKLEKPLLPSIPSSTKRDPSNWVTIRKNFTASTLLSDKKNPLLPIWFKPSKTTTLCTTLSLLPPPPQKLLPYSSWPHIPDVPSENISETMENTPLLSMTIYLNRPLLTDKCLFCWEDHPVEKLIQEMCFISTVDCWRELPKWTPISEVDLWLPYQLLKPRPVMCLHISQLTLFPSLTDKFSWKPNCSSKELDQLSMSVCPCLESVQPLKLLLWNRLPVNLNWNWPNTEKFRPLLNSVLI